MRPFLLSNAPFPNSNDDWGYLIQQNLASVGAGYYELQILGDTGATMWVRTKVGGNASTWSKFWTSKNTTTDSNGFIKAASPVIKLFAEKIEANEEALEQEPVFEKVDIGHYLLKNTEGFSDDGWYIEMPKDANGNVLVAVQYQQLEDNTSANSSEKREQIWFIEQKTSENAQQVMFELSNPVDFEGLKIPTRQISNYCNWEYRSEECGYIGSAMFTEKDEPTDNPALDRCNYRTSGCRCRENELHFGGFPASSMV